MLATGRSLAGTGPVPVRSDVGHVLQALQAAQPGRQLVAAKQLPAHFANERLVGC